VEDLAQDKDLNALVRQEDHIKNVLAHAEREFEKMTKAPKYLEEALPKLIE
jgi:hypothetical protein